MQDHWNSQTMLHYFFLPLLPMLYDGVNMLKKKKKRFLMLVILTNHEYLNELQGGVSSKYQYT